MIGTAFRIPRQPYLVKFSTVNLKKFTIELPSPRDQAVGKANYILICSAWKTNGTFPILMSELGYPITKGSHPENKCGNPFYHKRQSLNSHLSQ